MRLQKAPALRWGLRLSDNVQKTSPHQCPDVKWGLGCYQPRPLLLQLIDARLKDALHHLSPIQIPVHTHVVNPLHQPSRQADLNQHAFSAGRFSLNRHGVLLPPPVCCSPLIGPPLMRSMARMSV